MTGSPSMASRISSKSSRCSSSRAASAASSSSGVSARIMRWASGSLSPRNMCSVRHSPIPSAPYSRARAASGPLSALARTPMRPRRMSSAHPRMVANSGGGTAGASSSWPSMTSPEVPSTDSHSPSRTVVVPVVKWRRSTVIDPAPTTAGMPQPRATTAAWLTRPPWLVSTASAACMPATSSGEVSVRTSTAFSPRATAATTSAASK